jgi:hypothetical protein
MKIYLIINIITTLVISLFFRFKLKKIDYNLEQISDNLDKIKYQILKDKYDYD